MAFVGEPSCTWRNSLESFDDFDACEKARVNVIESYQANEKNILGGLCSRDKDHRKYRVVLLKGG
jgi:hypothetical protein